MMDSRRGAKKMHRGYRNDSDRGAWHPGPNSGAADKVYAGENTADQTSGGARQEPRGDWGADRRDSWFAASHLLQVRHQSAAPHFEQRNHFVAARGTAFQPGLHARLQWY